MTALSWLNSKRLRDYPRLIFIGSWVVLLSNLILHRGWLGGITNYLMFGDFLTYYAAGKLYVTDIAHLYDLTSQLTTQLKLLGATQPIEFSIFSYPPNSALLYSALIYLPVAIAALIWSVIAVFAVIMAVRLLNKYLQPEWLKAKGLSVFQLSIIIFSSFPFIEGFEKGQSNSLTFLLIVGVLISTRREKWFLAGLLAALSTYKPHFIIGFLILWLVWGKFKALFSFVAFSLVWNGIVILTKGIGPYLSWLKLGNEVLYIPYTSLGFPKFLISTTFSFIASLLPIDSAAIWNKLFLLVAISVIILFMAIAYKIKNRPSHNQDIVYALAILLPFVAFPHALLHDLLLMVPVLILLLNSQESGKNMLYLAIGSYIAVIVLPIAGYLTNIALLSIIPTGMFIYCIQRSIRVLRV